jgi:predicted nicotinamide N-methyase
VDSYEEFVRAHTRLTPVPYVPELRLHLAGEAIELWERTEADRGAEQPPPFWAFAWAGGQGVARYLLDRPETVRGRRVLDLATGSGLAAVAAARAGAAAVTGNDVDPYALAALALNAAANGVAVTGHLGDLLDGDGGDADVVLAGDVFYSRELARRVLALLDRAAVRGATVVVGDPGRAYLPRERFAALAEYDVPVTRALEDGDVKRTTVWRLVPARHDAPSAVENAW